MDALIREISLHSSAEERYLYPLITYKLDPPGAARALYDRLAMMDGQVGGGGVGRGSRGVGQVWAGAATWAAGVCAVVPPAVAGADSWLLLHQCCCIYNGPQPGACCAANAGLPSGQTPCMAIPPTCVQLLGDCTALQVVREMLDWLDRHRPTRHASPEERELYRGTAAKLAQVVLEHSREEEALVLRPLQLVLTQVWLAGVS